MAGGQMLERRAIGQTMEYIVRVQSSLDDNGHAPRAGKPSMPHGRAMRQLPQAIVCAATDEVIGPDVIGPARPQTDAGSVVEPQPAPFRLLLWARGSAPPAAPRCATGLAFTCPSLRS